MPYRLDVYVPADSSETLKQALFAAGAGKIGNYDCCCYELRGTGQFRPLLGSNPTIGEKDKVCTCVENKIELIIADECMKAVLKALRDTHPYETPAFQYWKVHTEFDV